MAIKADYYSMIIVSKENSSLLKLEKKFPEGKIYFEQAHSHPYIIDTNIHSTNGSINQNCKILYSQIGRRSIFTTYLGIDFNGPLKPYVLSWDNKRDIQHMEIEHVCSPERLIERHLEIISGNHLNSIKGLSEYACHEYYKLIFAMLE